MGGRTAIFADAGIAHLRPDLAAFVAAGICDARVHPDRLAAAFNPR